MTADGDVLAISIPRTEAHVIRHSRSGCPTAVRAGCCCRLTASEARREQYQPSALDRRCYVEGARLTQPLPRASTEKSRWLSVTGGIFLWGFQLARGAKGNPNLGAWPGLPYRGCQSDEADAAKLAESGFEMVKG
jgi:hypothetical protein